MSASEAPVTIIGRAGGAWSAQTHAQLYPANLNQGLVRFIAEEIRPRTFLEFGSGQGLLANALATALPLEASYCVEPLIQHEVQPGRNLRLLNADVLERAPPSVLNHKFDLVLSIEVAEHIPRERHDALFDFLASRTKRWVVFSGARPGQGGHGHVAERPETEWREEFTSRGLSFDPRLTALARTYSDSKNINHRQNIQVFRRGPAYEELDSLEAAAKPYLDDLLAIIQGCSHSLIGNLFYVDLSGALGRMPEDSLKVKRLNLLHLARAATEVLEIGFNAGHSALLMLLANETARLTVVDLFDTPYAQPCFDYLASVFPGRLTSVPGDSMQVLDLLRERRFDLVHYDGGKDKTIASDLAKTAELVRRDHVLVIDDTQNAALDAVVRASAEAGDIELATFARQNSSAAARPWKHKLARFRQQERAVDEILAQVGEIYRDTSFPSIYTSVKSGSRLAGYERARSLMRCVRNVEEANLSGSFVEVGVAAGHSSVIAALAASRFVAPRDFFLFDTFDGFPELPDEKDHEGNSIRSYDLSRYRTSDCDAQVVRDRVLAAGANPDRLFVIKGMVEHTAGQIDPAPIAILRLDADLFDPTYAALSAFYDRLSPGGFLIVDDYGHWTGCREAVDRFFAERGEQFESAAIDYTCHVAKKCLPR